MDGVANSLLKNGLSFVGDFASTVALVLLVVDVPGDPDLRPNLSPGSSADGLQPGRPRRLPWYGRRRRFFIGISGARWLQSERDKGRWQAAAHDAVRTDADYGLTRNLSLASSDQAAQTVAKAGAEVT